MADYSIMTSIFQNIANTAFADRPDTEHKQQSIKTLTKDLILQFPLLVSENIDPKNAAKLAEGFESENAILVKLLIMNDMGSLTRGSEIGSTADSLKRIHTNINSNLLNEGKISSMINENLKQLIPIEDKFNKWSLNEATLPKYLNEAVDRREHTRTVGDAEETHESRISVDNQCNIFEKKAFEKINKIAPTFIHMNISYSTHDAGVVSGVNQTNRTLQEKTILFGVKCVVHPLQSDDIIHNISINFTNSTLFKLIKWTTGEYKFAQGVGEVIFDYSRMKELGIQASKSSNYWWFKLKKLKNANRGKNIGGNFLSNKTKPTKTSTLVITKDEVDYIAREYRIDLKNPNQAYKLLNDLFLLNFAYIDESIERVYLFDEVSRSYNIKEISDFENKQKAKPIDVDDIKSLFGR